MWSAPAAKIVFNNSWYIEEGISLAVLWDLCHFSCTVYFLVFLKRALCGYVYVIMKVSTVDKRKSRQFSHQVLMQHGRNVVSLTSLIFRIAQWDTFSSARECFFITHCFLFEFIQVYD